MLELMFWNLFGSKLRYQDPHDFSCIVNKQSHMSIYWRDLKGICTFKKSGWPHLRNITRTGWGLQPTPKMLVFRRLTDQCTPGVPKRAETYLGETGMETGLISWENLNHCGTWWNGGTRFISSQTWCSFMVELISNMFQNVLTVVLTRLKESWWKKVTYCIAVYLKKSNATWPYSCFISMYVHQVEIGWILYTGSVLAHPCQPK